MDPITMGIIAGVNTVLGIYGMFKADQNALGCSNGYWSDISKGLTNGSYTHKEVNSTSWAGRTAWVACEIGSFKPYSEDIYYVTKGMLPSDWRPASPIVYDYGEGTQPRPGKRPGFGRTDYNFWHENVTPGGYLQKTGFDRLMADYNPVLAKACANIGMPDDVFVTQNRPVYTFNGSGWQIGPLTFYDKEGNFYEVDSSLKVSLSDANTKQIVNNGDLIGTFQGQSIKNALSVSESLFATKQLEDAQVEDEQEPEVVKPTSKVSQFLKDYGSYMFLVILGSLLIYFFKLKKSKK